MKLELISFVNKACFIRRILVASNAIQTMDNLLFELHSTRPKFDV
jgi:hypothetical protein